jgi:hypothetical protein
MALTHNLSVLFAVQVQRTHKLQSISTIELQTTEQMPSLVNLDFIQKTTDKNVSNNYGQI